MWDGLYSEALEAVVICPSNPLISIDPILAVPGIRQALRSAPAPVVAVSPIVAGTAVKGPTAKMMTELSIEVSALSVAERYRDLIDGFVIDEADAALADRLDVPCRVTATLMHDDERKRALAQDVLAFATGIATKVVRREIKPADHERLIAEAIDELSAGGLN